MHIIYFSTFSMDMKTQTGLLIVVLVAVSGIGGYLLGQERDGSPMHKMSDGSMMMDRSMGMPNAMAGMMSDLEGKEGDALDRAFLKGMITHHEGAVEMAQAVLSSGKHPELKQMATAIIEAQTKEIAQMKAWQTAWYGK